MANGFDMGVVVLLDYVESLATFFTHPSHDEYVRGFSFFFSIPPPHPISWGRTGIPWRDSEYRSVGIVGEKWAANSSCHGGNRVNELYEAVCEQGSTIGYDIEF